MKNLIRLSFILSFLVILLFSIGENPSKTQAQDPVTTATVSVDILNVRAQPGTDSAIIDAFAFGTVVNVSGREDALGNGGIWVFAQPTTGGTQGWVLWEFLQFPSNFIVETLPVIQASGNAAEGANANIAPVSTAGGLPGTTTRGVNFRSGPGTNYGILQGLTEGVRFTANGRLANNTWVRAIIGSQQGWLFAQNVSLSSAEISSLAVVEAPASTGTVASTTNTSGTTPVLPPPTISGGGMSGFSYGAHVANFDNTDLMRQTGMTWAKVQVRYGRGASPEGAAGLINAAHSQGLRILLGVVGYPGDVAGGEAYFNEYATYVGGLAALGADAIEVWNEPNLDREWQQGLIDGGLYTQLLAVSYNAIKARNPNTMVIAAAMAPTGAEGAFGLDRVWNDDRFLRSMAAAGAARYMDCLGVHYNEGIVSPTQLSGDPRNQYYTRYMRGMINTYRAIFPTRPLCFTELGYLSGEGFPPLPGAFGWAVTTSVAEHALWLAQSIDVARASGVVRMVIFWNLNFTGVWGDDPMGGYAMIRPDGTCPACNYLPR